MKTKTKKFNRTYKKRLTKKQTQIKFQKVLGVAFFAGMIFISGYGQDTLRYLDKTQPEHHISYVKAEQEAPKFDVISETIREVTMYNAGDPNQCDNTPCISANGENVCTSIAQGYKRCAANFVPFGTQLLIENYGICMVVDRMNSRYANRVDIAVPADEHARAVNFGLQRLNVKIIKMID